MGTTWNGGTGTGVGLGGIARLSGAVSRSISAENPTGGPGQGGRSTDGPAQRAARDLGVGWKVSPYIRVDAGETAVLAAIDGPGAIEHIWLTTHRSNWRRLLLRFHWDGDPRPAVEVPVGDFFAQGWGQFAQVSSAPVAVNPNGGFNCYWPMPFRRAALISLENVGPEQVTVYYQVDYALPADGAADGHAGADDAGADDAGDGTAYFHAQWRRSNPLPYQQVHTLLDGIEGRGHYVGTYLAWGVNSSGWWGEGEVKFYLDGDGEYPTICGTGTEDYFGGAWNFDVPGAGYTPFSTPYLGLPQIIAPDGLYASQQRFGMYRWHLLDPVRFHRDLRVTIQALGWRSGGRYLPLQDDIASTAFWYGAQTSYPRPPTPDADTLEIC